MTSRYWHELVTLWVVIDPIGTLPVFLAVTAHMSAVAARRVAIRDTLIAFLVLMFFVLFGQLLLTTMEIGMSSFQVAGNIVLFLFALTMIFGESKLEEEKHEEKEKLVSRSDMERAVYPLAIPSIASPGAMLGTVAVAHLLPQDMRRLFLAGTLSMELSVIDQNRSIGIKVDF